MLFVYFIMHCFPCMKVHEITILKPIEVIEIYMFLKYLHTQINKKNKSFKKKLKSLWIYICIKFERQINEATFFLKKQTNDFNIYVVHLWFANKIFNCIQHIACLTWQQKKIQ